MRVVICGGGVIGACTAYYLASRGVDVIVVERTEVAAAASGKAGGFLALDWCAGTALDALARRSFLLHAALRDEIGGDWAYQRLSAYSGVVLSDRDRGRYQAAQLDWLSERVVITHQLGTPETNAIVHPRKFTSAIMTAAQKNGAELRPGRATGIARSPDGARVRGVEVDGRLVEADAVVVAMGPWSLLAADWMPLPAVFGQRSPSVVYDTVAETPTEALFLDYREMDGSVSSVEVFPRADGSIHVTAFSDIVPLPLDPATITPDKIAIERLQAVCERLSSIFRADRIIARQACFRPVTEDGLPLIGKVPGLQGAYVATGHNVWGILNAPATGEALAALIIDGTSQTTDLTPFDPARLRPLERSLLRSS